MSGSPVPPAETTDRQRLASDPKRSAWVSANAGSGKTWVLAQRVVRCLLAGTPAHRILCLTFTKAAAAQMANRVFARLGEWATMADDALAGAIAELDGGTAAAVGRGEIARARRLFAEALETPGGLKIQTIHAFCESILQQFPLEADLGGNFDILDDRRTREAIDRARERVIVTASAADPDDPLARALAGVLAIAGEGAVGTALDAVIAARDDLRRWLRETGDLDAALADLAGVLGIDPGDDDATLAAAMLASPEFPAGLLERLADDLSGSGKRDQEQARLLVTVRSAAPFEERLSAWRGFFFKKDGEPKSANFLASQAVQRAHPDLLDRAAREVARLRALADRRAGLAALAATSALLRLGDRVIGLYEAEKRARSALDFDDLVGRTADLLSRSDAAQWVQYKLDKGIDHVLVDEAQDTNPRQWRIVHGLTGEFFAGEGARRSGRTIFAVGDEKQSIYSFQGAAPATFSQNRDDFRRLSTDAGQPFEKIELRTSFRSTRAVLAAVDEVFRDPALRARLLADPTDYTEHTAVRERDPGLVEVWPMIRAETEAEPSEWVLPLDRATSAAPHVRLARRIADEIRRLVAPDGPTIGDGRGIRPKDVMVLVRKRGAFVDAMNRVLKERGIAVAGQDRLRLSDHIAVADLIALGRVMVMPDDDLSLAAVLKSPLFGRDDDDLVDLAATRGAAESLAAALARRGGEDPGWRATADLFERRRGLARRLPIFEFYARVLSADGGRRAFVARLGSEVDDILDEFLALALAADRGPAPSLGRFVEGLATDAPEIKRELDEARDEVRVMTVHGAKGLEAPVVFLVDGGGAPVHAAHDPALLRLPRPAHGPEAAPALVWSRGRDDPAVVAARREAHREATGDEYLRLLYVAMTRAADRLIVCGHAGTRAPSADCWHSLITAALEPGAQTIEEADGSTRLVWTAGPSEPRPRRPERRAAATAEPARPDWLDRPPPAMEPARRLTPSTAGEDDERPRRPAARLSLEAALRPREPERLRGLLTHRLLEALPALPAEARRAAGERHLLARGASLPAEMRAAILDEVTAILDHPDFAAVFAEGSRAEAEIAGRVAGRDGAPVEITGRIDRLAVTPSEVLVVDFKTDRVGEDDAEAKAGQVAQLALYRRLLGDLFPGRRIRCGLLWTALPRLDEIGEDALEAAARRLGLSPWGGVADRAPLISWVESARPPAS